MKNIILLIVFTIILSLTGIIAIKLINLNLPAIQFFLNPTHKPSPTEISLLKKAGRNPSPSDFKYLNQQMLTLAKSTPYIEIGKCSPYPLFAKIYSYGFIKFTNSDTKTHTLILRSNTDTTKGKGAVYTNVILPPGKSKELFIDFYPHINTSYGYYCDNSKEAVGILYLEDLK